MSCFWYCGCGSMPSMLGNKSFDATRSQSPEQRPKDKKFVEQHGKVTRRRSHHTRGNYNHNYNWKRDPWSNEKGLTKERRIDMKENLHTELKDIGPESVMKHVQASKREALSFVRDAIHTLPVGEIIPKINSFNSSYRADIALILAEQGNGALVFAHLNDTFADVHQHDLAGTLIKAGYINVLAEYLHYFDKRSLNGYIAGMLVLAGYKDQVMNMPGIFSCSLDDLKFIVTSGLYKYIERAEYTGRKPVTAALE